MYFLLFCNYNYVCRLLMFDLRDYAAYVETIFGYFFGKKYIIKYFMCQLSLSFMVEYYIRVLFVYSNL